jgi:hypothetical protein
MSRDVAWAVRLVRWWVRTYSAGLPADAREARRAELESDLWEHARSGDDAGRPARALAGQILARCLFGMPGDLAWRAEAGVGRTRRADVSIGQQLKRSWWVPAPIALGSWLAVVALAHLVGDGWESPWQRAFAVWSPGGPGRAASAAAFAGMAAACFAAVAVRRRRPGLAVALPVPAELLNLTPLMWGEITLWYVLPILSIVTVAGTLYNMGRSVEAGADHPPERTETAMKHSRKRSERVEAAPRHRFGPRRVTASLVALAAMLALYPVASGVARTMGEMIRDTVGGGDGARTRPGTLIAAGDVVVAGAPVVGADPGQSSVGVDPIAGALPVATDPEASSTGLEGASVDCGGSDSAAVVTAVGPAHARLAPTLQTWLASYGRNDGNDSSDEFWMNTGGEFGGGIPSEGVREFLRIGAGAGLASRQLMDIVRSQSFMHAAGDPDGGAGLLEYIGANPHLYSDVAAFVADAPAVAGWGAESGQSELFGAFPELAAVYSALAGPLHTTGDDYATVDQLMQMTQQSGEWGELARTRLDEVLTYGPRASSADKGMARYVARSGYLPTASEALAGETYWNAYMQRVQQVQSGLVPGLWNALPVAPSGAGRPMALTIPARSAGGDGLSTVAGCVVGSGAS